MTEATLVALTTSQLAALEIGIDETLTAILKVCESTVVQQAIQRGAQAPELEPFKGFIAAIRDNRETFKQQILGVAVENFPAGDAPVEPTRQ